MPPRRRYNGPFGDSRAMLSIALLRGMALIHTCYYQANETVRLIAGPSAYHAQFGVKNENYLHPPEYVRRPFFGCDGATVFRDTQVTDSFGHRCVAD